MMRTQLQQCQLTTFTATFVRWGGANEKRFTALLADVRDSSGNILCPYVWVRINHELLLVKPMVSEVIRFEAIVQSYQRKDKTMDYALTELRHIRTIRS